MYAGAVMDLRLGARGLGLGARDEGPSRPAGVSVLGLGVNGEGESPRFRRE